MRKKMPPYQKTAYTILILLIAIIVFCLAWIWSHHSLFPPAISNGNSNITADIFQNGVLIQSIDLSAVTESYTFTATGENNCCNEIEVRPGSIGIISANCPDKLCVHQGFIDSSLLPVTCLPNRLVIQIRTDEITTDIISY